MNTHPTKAQSEVIALLELSPGGITSEDVRLILVKYGLVHIGSFMTSLAAWAIFWEQRDPEDGEIWYHASKFDHLYPDNHFARPASVKRVRKSPAKIRVTNENPGNYAWIKIDCETCNQIKKAAAETGKTMLEWLADAITKKLERKDGPEITEPTWKYTTLAGVRLPRDLINRVKKTLVGTEFTIGEFCREAAREKMGGM